MKILFVTDLCPVSDEETKLPCTLLNFILDFKKLGHEVTLLRPNVIFNVLIRKRKILPEGEFVYRGIRCINKNYWTPFFTKKQFDFLKKEDFDLILSHMPSGILAANKISEALNLRYFAGIHSSDIKILSDIKYFFIKKAAKEAYKKASGVLCRSYWIKNRIEKLIPEVKEKTAVIPSGIEKENIISNGEINLKRSKFYESPFKIFSCGKLIKRKGFDLLIKAMGGLEDAELLIAGDGEEKKNLEKLIKKLNLKGKVKLLGQKPKEEIYKLMDEAAVFILPSKEETFGMVYLEALARGLIVVCPFNSGISGFIKNRVNGFLLENYDIKTIKELADEIRHLENPEVLMQNAVDTAKSLEREKVSLNYINLIQNILF